MGVGNEAVEGGQSEAVKWSFYVGAIFFYGAVLFTVLTTKEYSPDEMKRFEEDEATERAESTSKVATGPFGIPSTMYQLAVVQFFTWFALFALFIFATPSIARHVYGAEPKTDLYEQAGNWVGIGYMFFNGVAAIMGFILPAIAKAITRRYTHMICLALGGVGLMMAATPLKNM